MPLINAKDLDGWRHSSTPPILVDASWHLPSTQRDAKAEFLTAHLPGAHFLDLDVFNDPEAPGTLSQDADTIQQHVALCGARVDQSIVFYDRSDLHTACRAYWIFRLWGFSPDQLYVLDGGFNAYDRQGFITSSGQPNTEGGSVNIRFQPHLLKTLDQVKTHLRAPEAQIIDLRHAVRFAGGPETRKGLRRGHIPGSFCFPFSSCFGSDGHFLPFEKIVRRLNDIGVDSQSPIITCCGSGVTATILNFVLDGINHSNHSLYDGSWAEWGAETCFPSETSLLERPIETCLEGDSSPHSI